MNMEEEVLVYPDEEESTFTDKSVEYLMRGSDYVVNFFSSYGWYLFAIFVVIIFYWKKIQSYLDKVYEKYEARKYAEKYHKNPDLALERLEGLQRARERMQEELNRKAIQFAEKQKERERQKLKEKIEKLEGKENGQRLGDGSSGSSYRSDYNPLMGDTTSRRYTPQRRGCPGA